VYLAAIPATIVRSSSPVETVIFISFFDFGTRSAARTSATRRSICRTDRSNLRHVRRRRLRRFLHRRGRMKRYPQPFPLLRERVARSAG